jgi:hypothetical protein
MLMSTPVCAAVYVFTTPLSPEAPGATGSGSAQVTLDTTARTLSVMTDWSGLSGLTTVAHIHCCVAAPGTVGVAVTPGTFPGFPVGVSSGSYSSGALDLSNASTYTASFLTNFGGGTTEGAQAALLTGLQEGTAYLNIHTNTFPAGEIRGFLTAVPEPQSWALMIVGFGLVGASMRLSRRAHRERPSLA